MKWIGVLLFVLIVPTSAPAAPDTMKKDEKIFDVSTMPMHSYILDGTIQSEASVVRLLKFVLLPLRDLMNIHTQIRLYFPKDPELLPNETPKGRCFIKIKGQGVFYLRDYFIYKNSGTEIWVTELADRQLAEMFILWQSDALELQYAQTVVKSGPYQSKKSWITQANWESMRDSKFHDTPGHFREVLLDDVCLKADQTQPFPFSEKELKTFQFFK